jgi:hypothetical protein
MAFIFHDIFLLELTSGTLYSILIMPLKLSLKEKKQENKKMNMVD